ncbi:hypothetical protein AVDCRST_MAG81-1454, partial [uncultured Synechococcales cyanobacterium]
ALRDCNRKNQRQLFCLCPGCPWLCRNRSNLRGRTHPTLRRV